MFKHSEQNSLHDRKLSMHLFTFRFTRGAEGKNICLGTVRNGKHTVNQYT